MHDESEDDSIEHDLWFREQVQEALDDPGPGIPHEVVMAETRAQIDRISAEKLRKAHGE